MQRTLKVIQQNVIKWTSSRKNELSNYYIKEDADIILINATGLRDNERIKIYQYNLYQRNRSGEAPAGIAIAIKNVRAPLANSRINWVYDSPPSQSHHIAPRQNTPKSNNNVPRNCPIAQSSDVRMSAPRGNISRSVWHNSTLSFRSNNCPPVPKNNATNRQTDAQKIVSPPPKKKRINYKRRERRVR